VIREQHADVCSPCRHDHITKDRTGASGMLTTVPYI
jgi:hypothetical protein